MATLRGMAKNRPLLILGISESVSNTGSWVTMMAVYAMLVFQGKGGLAESSGVFLAGLLPMLVFSPAAGWLCDRFDRRKLMIGSELLSGAVIGGLIFARQPAVIYALLALQAVTTALMTPARQAVVPQVVPPEELTRANAFLQQLAGIIKIAAPSLAGLVLTLLSPHQAIILDVV
ncbi:MAG TPA: MFS transporter, partial [Anaerolineaceae bacterium]